MLKFYLLVTDFMGRALSSNGAKKHGGDIGYVFTIKSDHATCRREITTGGAAKQGIKELMTACFNKANVATNISIIHETDHPEPWIIAMDCQPSFYKALDYGMRWGIEAMFADFKSKGFSVTQTHLKHADIIERLILVLTIALYWAVSTGMEIEPGNKKYTKKTAEIFDFLF